MSKRKKTADPVFYLGPESRWKMLGVAIVKQAVFDWKNASMKLARPDTASQEMLKLKRESEKWLMSPWCEFYSDLDGKTLVRKLKAGEL